VHRSAGNITRWQDVADLYGVSARLRPCRRKSAGKDAGAGCTPNLIRLDPNSVCRASNGIDCFGHFSTERHKISRAPVFLLFATAGGGREDHFFVAGSACC
jgi:hypothetical protein